MKRIIQTALIIVMSFCIFHLSKPLRAEIHLRKGRAYIDSGYPFKAIDEYQKAERLDPVNGMIYFQKGVAFGKISQKKNVRSYMSGYLGNSINTFKTALKFTNDTAIDFYLAAGYEKSGEVDRAFEIYRSIIEKDPKSKSAKLAKKRLKNIFRDRGDRSFKEGKREEAVKNYKTAIELNSLNSNWGTIEDYEKYAGLMPDNLLVHFYLGEAYYKNSRWKEAVREFDRLEELNVRNREINIKRLESLLNLVRSYSAENLIDEAERYYKRIMKLDSLNRYGFYGKSVLSLGRLYEKNRDWNRAVDVYNKYLKYRRPEDTEIFDFIARIYLKMDRLEEAEESFLKLEEFTVKKGAGYRRIGDMYQDNKMWGKAIDAYEKYLSYYSEREPAIFSTLAGLYKKTGQRDKAIKTYLKLENMDTAKGLGYFYLGDLYQGENNIDKAIEYYEKYLPFRSLTDTSIFVNLGELYQKAGRKDKAIETFMKLETFAVTKGTGYLQTGDLYRSSREYKKAAAAYEKYLKYRQIRDVGIFSKLADVYYMINEIDKSVQAYLELEKHKTTIGRGYLGAARILINKKRWREGIDFCLRAAAANYLLRRDAFMEILNNIYKKNKDMIEELPSDGLAPLIDFAIEEEDPEICFEVGSILMKRGIWKDSTKMFQKAIALDSFNLKGFYYRGYERLRSIYIRLGDLKSEQFCLKKILEIKRMEQL